MPSWNFRENFSVIWRQKNSVQAFIVKRFRRQKPLFYFGEQKLYMRILPNLFLK